jgi:predicted PurR-regulated permease PerM
LLFAFALGFDFGFGAAFLTAAFFAGAFFAGAFFAAFFTAGFVAFFAAFFTAFFTAFLAAFFTAFFAAFFAGFFLVAMFVLSSKVCVALEESHNLTPNFQNYQSSSYSCLRKCKAAARTDRMPGGVTLEICGTSLRVFP